MKKVCHLTKSNSMQTLLALEKITKLYEMRCILKDISLSVDSGSLNLLMGANGAGKTTLLRIMAGLSKASMGQVQSFVDEKEIGYLGHATFIYPELTAYENLSFWAKVYARADIESKDIDNVLKRVELQHFATERAGVFSRGMAQRLNLARVLLQQPKLWLLDEPTTGLDVRSTQLLVNEMQEVKKQSSGIVWISHDLDSHAHLADNVWKIEKSRLITLAK